MPTRSPRRNARSRGRSGRTFFPTSGGGGGGGGGIGSGVTLLKAYATAVGTDESDPRVITFTAPSTAGRDLVAIHHGSGSVTMPSPWTQVQGVTTGTVTQIWTLSKANNSGISGVTVNQPYGGTAYPFAMVIFEDDVSAFTYTTNPANVAPSGGTWSTNAFSPNGTWRSIGWWGAENYQSAPGATVSGYNNGLTQFADTGVSSIYNSAHAAWYSCRTWAAWVDGLSGSTTLTATATSTNTGTGWAGILAYTVG